MGPLPDQPRERQHLTVTIDTPDAREARLDAACVAAAKRDADPTVSLEEVRMMPDYFLRYSRQSQSSAQIGLNS